jgi:beta-galactosidase
MSTLPSQEIFGAEIQYFRLEPRYWEPVLQRFQETGLRCVTTYVQWNTHLVGPPDADHPAGHFDFEGKTDPRRNVRKFLDLVESRGFNLNFRCGPFCCNEMIHGGYPDWLVMGDPNMMVWDYQNRTTQGYWIGKREGSQPSYLHPDYLHLSSHWLRAVDAIVVPHLRANGGCITMMNLDNEISYIVKDSFLDSDYNPVNVRPGGFWHQFLAEKYGEASALPYDTAYPSIDAVPPPRAVPASITRDLAWYRDWMEFKTWAMQAYIHRLRAMHEENGVKDLTFMTNLNPHRPEGVPTRLPAFEEAVGKGGIVGYDFYRGTFMSYSGYQSMARVLKLMNASLSYTWSAEFMSGTWERVLSTRVSDDHMRFMARCALAQGCKSISWFMFHDRDCWGDSPVSTHGHARPSLEVLTETPRLLFEKLHDWDAMVPQTDVAILYDLIQHVHTALGDPAPCADNELHIGKPLLAGVEAGRASGEYEALFRLVEYAGVQPGVVDLMHSPGALMRYPLAFLPGSPVIERAVLEALKTYVHSGGTLVVSGPVPTLDENGRPLEFLEQRTFVHHPDYLGGQPEQDDLAAVDFVSGLVARHVPAPHVRIRPESPVSWVGWIEGGGHGVHEQPRNLGTAVLHRGEEENVLFVLNHHPDAVNFVIEFPQDDFSELCNLDSGEVLPIRDRTVVVDVDRKAASIFSVR